MSRFGARFVPNIEHEVRKQATEPVVKWRQEWVVPTNTSTIGSSGDAASASTSATVGVKILKWVKVDGDVATFPEEQDVQAEDRVHNDAAIVEAPVQSIHNVPAVSTPSGPSLTSAGGGLGTIAPKEPPSGPASSVAPASAIPAHVTQSFSESTSGANTTGDNTPTDSAANTPPASAPEDTTAISAAPSSQAEAFPSVTSALATGANTPQVEPQVEAQLHDQPTASTADNETLAVLAGQAEAEQQPATEATDVTHVAADPATTGPAAHTDTEGVRAQADVEMNDA